MYIALGIPIVLILVLVGALALLIGLANLLSSRKTKSPTGGYCRPPCLMPSGRGAGDMAKFMLSMMAMMGLMFFMFMGISVWARWASHGPIRRAPIRAQTAQRMPRATDAPVAIDAPIEIKPEAAPAPVVAGAEIAGSKKPQGENERAKVDAPPPEEKGTAGEAKKTSPGEVAAAGEKAVATHAAPAGGTPPPWVGQEPFKDGSVYKWPVKCDPRPSQSECEEEALPAAVDQVIAEYIKTKLKLGRQAARLVRLPRSYVREQMIGDDVWVEPVEVSFGDWVRLHALVKFDRRANALIAERWATVEHIDRLAGVAVAGAILLLLLASAYTLLKIDLVTGGKYRGRLRLLVAATILLLVIAGWAIIRA